MEGGFECEDMPNTAYFSVVLLFFALRSECITSQPKPQLIFAGFPVCCSRNGGRIFDVFAALFLRNDVVKFEKPTLILIVKGLNVKLTPEKWENKMQKFRGSSTLKTSHEKQMN